jgi:hypothetical protein
MASQVRRPAAARGQVALRETSSMRLGGLRFDWAVVVLCAWFMGGVYLDGWAHNHLRDLETFFTPWHAVLYSGFGAVTAFLLAAAAWNHRHGQPWQQALPAGYGLSLLGSLIFALAGVGDMVWHTLLGIEIGVEALLSPPHLALALGGLLIVGGPLRAAWRRNGPAGFATHLPMLLALTFVLSVLTFMTQFGHPWVDPWAAARLRPAPGQANIRQALGVLGIVLQSGLLMGLVLLVARRWGRALPVGSFGLVFTLNAALLAFMDDEYWVVPVAALAGLATDGLLRLLRPSPARPAMVRGFAVSVPVVLYGLYFLALALGGGIWWAPPMWTGAIVAAGVTGLLLSYLVVPPALAVPPDETPPS